MSQSQGVVKVGDRIRITTRLSRAVMAAIRANQDHVVIRALTIERTPDGPAEIQIELGEGGPVEPPVAVNV